MYFRSLLLLFLLATLPFAASAQVGVNNNSPEQALDVDGKIKVTDDGTTPSNGTIRYNSPEDDFEGFAGGEWQSLTKSAVPNDPQPGYFAEFSVNPGSSSGSSPGSGDWALFDRIERMSDNQTFFQVIPGDQFFVVDQICMTLEDMQPGDTFYAGVRKVRDQNDNFGLNPQIFMSGGAQDGTKCMQSNRAPLLILQPGQTLQRWNSSNSDGQVRIMVYGFFVDELADYFQF